jgi:hypothetical protein
VLKFAEAPANSKDILDLGRHSPPRC